MKLKYDDIHSKVMIIVSIGFPLFLSLEIGMLYGIPAGLLCAVLFHFSMRPQKESKKKK